MKKDTMLWGPGQKPCDHCGLPIVEAVETWKGHVHIYCLNEDCKAAATKRPKSRYVLAGEVRCMAPNCKKHVPEGSYGKRTKHYVCSIACWHSLRYHLFKVEVPFKCEWCGKPGMGQIPPGKTGPRFCFGHAGPYRREENLKTAGRFRPVLDVYMDTIVPARYRGKSIPTHTNAVVRHLKFLNEVCIESLDAVTPQTISDYGKWGRDNGSPNLLSDTSHLTTFYQWLQDAGYRKGSCPVLTRIHRPRQRKTLPRPYDEPTMSLIWRLLEERGNSRVRAEAAIAEQAGMRRDEIINIRLADVDFASFRIFVRLPNKTNTERYALFGDKAKKYIEAWLKDRDPDCGHDHLFHNTEGNPCKGLQMHLEFVNVLCKELRGRQLHEEGLDSWSIHRLRHTMATRLARGGANVSTVMGAGGWTTYNAMLGYTGVDEETTRRGYDEAMRRYQEECQRPDGTVTLSLEEYLARLKEVA